MFAMIELVGNHLWQSTLFAAAAAALAWAMRRHTAQTRHGIWLAASLKFLVPFHALIALGGRFPLRVASGAVDAPLAVVIDSIAQPFAVTAIGGTAPLSTPAPSGAAFWPLLLAAAWMLGAAAIAMIWTTRWRRLRAAVLHGAPVVDPRVLDVLHRIGAGWLPVVSSESPTQEPGVFGVVRPVLLWPGSMADRLSDAEIEAILLHELAHVRRYDNLAGALHMVVQSIFWFHPLVWWLGARLVDERERACDDEVIRRGSEPQVYAAGILRTCEFCTEPSIACVSGVSGSSLVRRIERIMEGDSGAPLSLAHKFGLGLAATASLAAPLVAGALSIAAVPPLAVGDDGQRAQFDATFVRRSQRSESNVGISLQPDGRYHAVNVTLRTLINTAYGRPFQPLVSSQVQGAPGWVDVDRFDVLGETHGAVGRGPDADPALSRMLRSLLADRFSLVAHTERRTLPAYVLTMLTPDGQPGPQIRPADIDCSLGKSRVPPPPPPPPQPGQRPRCGITILRGSIQTGGMTIGQFANALSRLTNALVIDRTGLDGRFDLDLVWAPTSPPSAALDNIADAIRNQLGFSLVRDTAAEDVLVIDRVEPPRVLDDFVPILFPPPPPPPAPPRN